jgi:carboxymethylenebutenolidase
MARGLWLVWAGAVVALAACGSTEAPDADQEFLDSTASEHAADTPEPSPVAQAEPEVAIVSRVLAYGEADDRNLMGYLAMPADAAEPLPGLIVIHEWWGLNDNIRAAAERLAGEGYIALAVDLYNGQVAATPAEAQTLMGALMASQDEGVNNLRQAHHYLKAYALSPSVAAIGWCLGGGWALQGALALGEELDGVVMYYGRVITDEATLGALQAPLLGLFAGQDQAIKVADVDKFRSTLQQLGKDATIHVYPGADHAFANPSGGNYNAIAAEDAWTRTIEFLRSHLQAGGV